MRVPSVTFFTPAPGGYRAVETVNQYESQPMEDGGFLSVSPGRHSLRSFSPEGDLRWEMKAPPGDQWNRYALAGNTLYAEGCSFIEAAPTTTGKYSAHKQMGWWYRDLLPGPEGRLLNVESREMTVFSPAMKPEASCQWCFPKSGVHPVPEAGLLVVYGREENYQKKEADRTPYVVLVNDRGEKLLEEVGEVLHPGVVVGGQLWQVVARSHERADALICDRSGVVRTEPLSPLALAALPLPDGSFVELAGDEDGSLRLGQHALPEGKLVGLLYDGEGQLWVNMERGLYRYTAQGLQSVVPHSEPCLAGVLSDGSLLLVGKDATRRVGADGKPLGEFPDPWVAREQLPGLEVGSRQVPLVYERGTRPGWDAFLADCDRFARPVGLASTLVRRRGGRLEFPREALPGEAEKWAAQATPTDAVARLAVVQWERGLDLLAALRREDRTLELRSAAFGTVSAGSLPAEIEGFGVSAEGASAVDGQGNVMLLPWNATAGTAQNPLELPRLAANLLPEGDARAAPAVVSLLGQFPETRPIARFAREWLVRLPGEAAQAEMLRIALRSPEAGPEEWLGALFEKCRKQGWSESALAIGLERVKERQEPAIQLARHLLDHLENSHERLNLLLRAQDNHGPLIEFVDQVSDSVRSQSATVIRRSLDFMMENTPIEELKGAVQERLSKVGWYDSEKKAAWESALDYLERLNVHEEVGRLVDQESPESGIQERGNKLLVGGTVIRRRAR